MDAAAFATKIRDAFQPCCLGTWPTPLEPAPALAAATGADALWLKREDRAGGNKVRGLEFLLAGAPPRTVFVTVGATGSTHCLATAVLARGLGHRAALAQFPQPETAASRAVAAATATSADLVIRASAPLALPVALLRAWWGARRLGGGSAPRWIPGGGAHPRAVLGHVLAALELATQLDAPPRVPPPDAVVVPLGSGGTAAGIALGLAWLGWPTRVVAVRVAPRLVANRWRTLRLAGAAAVHLRRAGLEFRVPRSALRLDVVDGVGAGYGHPTPAGERAAALAAAHGLRLDPTYGAKAFAILPHLANGNVRRVVFWHTFAWP
ncbi:MAG TPA: pyridoxal-phosphate dependent enzyme [Gemmatimonadales bacterium]|nr:pyridoxal-phosphate dependent enzyme [Gemmatimonadales bacterium]